MSATDDHATAPIESLRAPAAVTREAVEILARREGRPVLEVLTVLQSVAARLDDGEEILAVLCAIKSEILEEEAGKASALKFPDVHVRLSGTDGNVFAIIGSVSRALRQGGATSQDVETFTDEVMRSGSYDEALQVVMRWVEVS